MTTTTEAPKADSKTDDKTDDKPSKPSKGKKNSGKQPTEDQIKAAMATLEAAGMMSSEEQMEEVVALKLRGFYDKIVTIIANLTDDDGNPEAPTDETPGIVIFPDGHFGYCHPEDEDEDEDEDNNSTSKGKKAKKGKSKKSDSDDDWRAEGGRLQKALIKYANDNDVQAQTIRDKLGDKDGKNPSLTTVYNWLNGKSVPQRQYHRKLRKLLGA